MARSKEQIADSIRTSITNTDNRLDLKVGALWDYLIAPIPQELAILESKVDILKLYYSPNFADVATSQEARDFAINFGTSPSNGKFARAELVFYRNSPPPLGITYTVPIGSLVQTIDGTLVYRTLKTIIMYGDYAPTYFNPASQRYEIQVTVEAVSPGQLYNIPQNHIRRMQNTINGFDGIQQISDAVGGTEAEDVTDVARRVQKKFKGLEKNSIGGIETTILEAESDYVLDVTVVTPTDRMEFRRYTSSPALDVYVLGENYTACSEDYLAVGGETSIPLTVNRTMINVTSVMINGTVLASTLWRLKPDTSLEYQYSTRANPYIQLGQIGDDNNVIPIQLSQNDLVEITGYRNQLLDSIQALFSGDNEIFKTDILVRSFLDLPIVVSLECRITSGDTDQIASLIQTVLINFIEPVTGIPTLLVPDNIKSLIKDTIPEVDTVKILKFKRKYGAMDTVEIIAPYKNQVPKYDAVASSIVVRL